MEEVSILTISMFFIVIYLNSIMCIYINILFYVVLQLLGTCRKPSTPMDAPMYVSTTDVEVEASFSIGIPHTHDIKINH